MKLTNYKLYFLVEIICIVLVVLLMIVLFLLIFDCKYPVFVFITIEQPKLIRNIRV